MKKCVLFLLLILCTFGCDEDPIPETEMVNNEEVMEEEMEEEMEMEMEEEMEEEEDGGETVEPIILDGGMCVEHDNTLQYDANRAFAFDLFRELNQDESYLEENIFMSPLSISLALAMLYNGATDPGKSEMEEAMGISGIELQAFNENYFCLMQELLSEDEKVTLTLANSIWSDDSFSANADFLERNEAYLNSSFFRENLQSPATIELVNDWISDSTEGLIQDMLASLPDDAVMLLINAIYFNGVWQYNFEAEDTEERDFNLMDGSTVMTPFMEMENDFQYLNHSDFRAVDLPYGDGEYSMTVFLPKYDINEFVDSFSEEQYVDVIPQFQEIPVHLRLPKFSVTFGTASISSVLLEMGMVSMFDQGSSSLDNIDPNSNLYVSDVLHKAFIEVSEEGTEAAAATVIVVGASSGTGSSGPEIEQLFLDEPFFYVIRERANNNILFTGKIVNPAD